MIFDKISCLQAFFKKNVYLLGKIEFFDILKKFTKIYKNLQKSGTPPGPPGDPPWGPPGIPEIPNSAARPARAGILQILTNFDKICKFCHFFHECR